MTSHLAPMPGSDRLLIGLGGLILIALLALPLVGSALLIDKLILLMIYVILAVMWNLLAGYVGLVSVGHQAFVGLAGYFMIRLVEGGTQPFLAIVLGAALVLMVAWPLSWFVLRLKAAEFAVAMWVIAEALRSTVMFGPLIQGETGRSLVAMNALDADLRRTVIYLMAVVAAAGALAFSHALLRGKPGAEAQAIRDDEEAAGSVGIPTMQVKRLIFILSALGCAVAGALWLASSITYQPRTAFGIQWSVFMLFMVLVGGLGSFLGPVIGAVVFFLLQEFFGDFGAWYLAGIGVVAMLAALYAPRGIMGLIIDHFHREPLSMGKSIRITRQQHTTSRPKV